MRIWLANKSTLRLTIESNLQSNKMPSHNSWSLLNLPIQTSHTIYLPRLELAAFDSFVVGLVDAMTTRSDVVGFATKARRKVVIKNLNVGSSDVTVWNIDWSDVDYPADGGLQS